MDKTALTDYLHHEVDECHRLFRDELPAVPSLRGKLRRLYGAPADRHVVYCESGSMEDLCCFPEETVVVVPVFPSKDQASFERQLGPMSEFRSRCEQGRIFPLVQHPLYYENRPHLAPFFAEHRAPSYFVRGPFAYALCMGFTPEIITNHAGIPVLTQIDDLMNYCESKHGAWVDECLRDEDCWEHRNRANRQAGDEFRRKHRLSIKYRFASVALCISRDVADEILFHFDTVTSAKILLHLHILFDHVICHGFGSDFCAGVGSDSATDLAYCKTDAMRRVERSICEGLTILLPKQWNEDFNALLREEHFLKGIQLDTFDVKDMDEIRERIERQVERFRQKVEKWEKRKWAIERAFTFFLMALGSTQLAQGNVAVGVGSWITALGPKEISVPDWLSSAAVKAMTHLHQSNLACYLVSAKWDEPATN